MKKLWLIILVGGIISIGGCSTHFTQNEQLQLDLSGSVAEPPAILAEFDSSGGEENSGDITKKSGSSCANGVCTIY